jgi:hypothetical protein
MITHLERVFLFTIPNFQGSSFEVAISVAGYQSNVTLRRLAICFSLLPVLGAAEISAIHRNRDDERDLLVGMVVFDIFKKLKPPVQSP